MDLLERGYRVVDEIGSSTIDARDMQDHRRQDRRRRDSISTREYADGRPEDPTRMEVIERSIASLARSVENMRTSGHPNPHRRESRPVPTTPFSRHDRDAYVQDFISKETMEIPMYEGRQLAHDPIVDKAIPKPYMFIEKFGLDTIKKKMDYRSSMTANEYVNAYVRMLCDNRVRDSTTLAQQLAHLKDVTTDIIARPWSAVRSWSQCVFDSIENSTYTWSDHQQIQNDRFRLSYNGLATDPQPVDASSRQLEVLCMEFNNRCCSNGGKFKHHVENGIRFVHACMYCFALTGACRDHGVNDPCNNKLKDRAAPNAHHAYSGMGFNPAHLPLHPPPLSTPQRGPVRRPEIQTPVVPSPTAPAVVLTASEQSTVSGHKKLLGCVSEEPAGERGQQQLHMSPIVYIHDSAPRSDLPTAQPQSDLKVKDGGPHAGSVSGKRFSISHPPRPPTARSEASISQIDFVRIRDT